MSLADIRRDYQGQPLDEQHADADPLRQFAVWMAQAREVETDPTAMTLATATTDGLPSARVVLLKGVDEGGFVFYTNYESRKGRELAENPRASLVFYWPSVNRQVRVVGRVERVSAEQSDAYFASRPADSRLAASVSPQSDPIAHREALNALFAQAQARHPGGDVPRPPFWGGCRVMPDEIEFWQGRESRLHDRLRYRRNADGTWTRDRLAP
ncbi:MAG: pyridoxamine 5'-phosphate oxidase [Vicinamibacterales bacterium]